MARGGPGATDWDDLFRRRGGGGSRSVRFAPPVGQRRFAILRVGKLKTMGHLKAAAQHNLRERETANADATQSPRNTVLVGASTAEGVAQAWRERAPDKVRSNAVHALEYVITASPEAMQIRDQEMQHAYFRDALAWLEDRHGAENILSAVIHEDEQTPHLQVMIIPLDDRGKLNARALVGGKAQLSRMQTDFADRVGILHGFERGIERSGAHHETIKSYYARAAQTESMAVEVPERLKGRLLGLKGESDEEWQGRASLALSEALRGKVAQSDQIAREALREAARNRKAAERAKYEAKLFSETADARQADLQMMNRLADLHRMTDAQMNDAVGPWIKQLGQVWDKLSDTTREEALVTLEKDFGLSQKDHRLPMTLEAPRHTERQHEASGTKASLDGPQHRQKGHGDDWGH